MGEGKHYKLQRYSFIMFNFKETFSIIKIPMIIVVLLTCLGILLNAINIPLVIFGWYAFVFFVLGLCLLWVGYSSGSKGLSVVDTGINGIVLWLIPGSVGLTINGLLSLLTAALWGTLMGVEILICGKIPSSRAKCWRFYSGYLKKCGDIALTGVHKAYRIARLKIGIVGIKVKIMPPDIKLPDKVILLDEKVEEVEEISKEEKGQEKEINKEEKKDGEDK